MTRKKQVYAQPIGFLTRKEPYSPYQAPSSYPYSPGSRPPFMPSQPFNPYTGGSMPTPNPAPANPGTSGIGGLLQNLLKGQGSLDVASMMSNAQKMIGVVNQIGTVVRNMSPMLEMLKGFNDSGTLSESDDHSSHHQPEKEKRGNKKRKKRYKRKRSSKQRRRKKKQD